LPQTPGSFFLGGREIWGKAVPYGQPWRSGANENTTIFVHGRLFRLKGTALPRALMACTRFRRRINGRYFFQEFHVVGQLQLRPKENALRVTVKAALPLSFGGACLFLRRPQAGFRGRHFALGKGGRALRVSADVNSIVLRSIQNQLRNTGGFSWAGYDEAANWLLDTNSKPRSGDEVAKIARFKSRKRFENLLGKSQILEAQGRRRKPQH